MSKVFKVNVNNQYDFDLNSDDISKLDTLKISESEYHIIQNHHSIKAEILGYNFLQKTYKVNIDNTIFNVNINNELDSLIKSMGFQTGKLKQVNAIKAPMPGLIIDVLVKENQEVKENAPILILEAMKMENVITSPINGVIKTISVKRGAAVDKNELLIEFDTKS